MTERRRDTSPCCEPPPGTPAQAMFPTGPEAAHAARAYVRELLADDDLKLADDRLDDVLLIVSELVTNAHVHGTDPGDSLLVTVLTTAETVRVEVDDPCRRRPQLRDVSAEQTGGRGLHIVDALAARWDVNDRPFGKKVWAEVTR
ncbi:ATP-binding protein [Streptomyces sp. NPDC006743]|uniref:ATP-binding protein n=1 Tax=Streptomyces sp. NPDC006743 TaxID=3154480 RepID=UPI0034562A55